MKGVVKKYIVYLLILLAGSFFSCSDNLNNFNNEINLSGKWTIIEKNISNPFKNNFDVKNYKKVSIPGDWTYLLKKNKNLEATVWLRKKIFIDKRYKSKLLTFIAGRIGIADETFFNGVMIGANGKIPHNTSLLEYPFSWQNPRVYHIPNSLIKYDGENIITIKIYSHFISGVMGNVGIFSSEGNYFKYFYSAYSPFFVTVVALSLNVIFFLGFFVMFLAQNSKKEYLYFAIIALLTLIGNIITIDTPFLLNGFLRYKIFLFVYTTVNLVVFISIQEFFNLKSRLALFVAFVFYFLLQLGVVFSPNTRSLIYVTGPIVIVFILCMIFASAFVFLLAIKKDPMKNWYFIFIALAIPISVVRNSYYLFSLKFNELPLIIFFHVPVVFSLIFLYVMYSFTQEIKNKGVLYNALLRKSRKTEKILKLIQKEKIKPDPRDVISEVVEYLDSHYNERYNRHELAEKFGLNADYMGQLFKKTTGKNISAYINTNRIDASKDLLSNTSAKVIDIAYHVGFDNLTHFYRFFKKQTELTPSEYRKIMLEDK